MTCPLFCRVILSGLHGVPSAHAICLCQVQTNPCLASQVCLPNLQEVVAVKEARRPRTFPSLTCVGVIPGVHSLQGWGTSVPGQYPDHLGLGGVSVCLDEDEHPVLHLAFHSGSGRKRCLPRYGHPRNQQMRCAVAYNSSTVASCCFLLLLSTEALALTLAKELSSHYHRLLNLGLDLAFGSCLATWPNAVCVHLAAA